jgi:hypothetical protein
MTLSRLPFAIATSLCLFGAPSAFAQGSNLPWGQSSDQVGWETFVQVTAPSGIPGSKNVEFETWASDEDLYLTNPPKWPTVPSAKTLHASVLALARAAPPTGPVPETISPGGCTAPGNATAGNFPAGACIGEEVRRNWASFQYIVGNNLFTRSGFAAAAQKKFVVDMPADSIEVKGDWVKLSDLKTWLKTTINKDLTDAQMRALYHVNTVKETSGETEYALVAFHFSSKQIKNWVWSDFEHELNPGRCDDTGCHDSFGAKDKDVAKKNSRGPEGQDINGNQDYGACLKTDALELMMKNAGIGEEWRHYCLKGTQITFVNADGTPSLLGNSVIERIDASVPILKSSCITCHATAAFKPNGQANGVREVTGNPPPLDGMIQNDFVWGVALPLRQQ